MKLYVPFRKDNAVWWPNALSSMYVFTKQGSAYLDHIQAFTRKKDAVDHMEKANAETEYPHEYKIICFESK